MAFKIMAFLVARSLPVQTIQTLMQNDHDQMTKGQVRPPPESAWDQASDPME